MEIKSELLQIVEGIDDSILLWLIYDFVTGLIDE